MKKQTLDTPFGVSLSPSDNQKLRELAQKRRTNRNRLIQQAVREFLTKETSAA